MPHVPLEHKGRDAGQALPQAPQLAPSVARLTQETAPPSPRHCAWPAGQAGSLGPLSGRPASGGEPSRVASPPAPSETTASGAETTSAPPPSAAPSIAPVVPPPLEPHPIAVAWIRHATSADAFTLKRLLDMELPPGSVPHSRQRTRNRFSYSIVAA